MSFRFLDCFLLLEEQQRHSHSAEEYLLRTPPLFKALPACLFPHALQSQSRQQIQLTTERNAVQCAERQAYQG